MVVGRGGEERVGRKCWRIWEVKHDRGKGRGGKGREKVLEDMGGEAWSWEVEGWKEYGGSAGDCGR